MRSTEEVAETLERDLEEYIAHNPDLVGPGLRLERQQTTIPVGRTDIHFRDENGNLIVVELKLGHIGRDAVKQLRRYLDELSKTEKKSVGGILVCAGVLPIYRAELENLRDVQIREYGWQLQTRPWP
jgi:RecB family endonuclease NucS